MSKNNLVPLETTLHVRDHCLCLHTQRAARTIARIFDDALKPVGLNNGQFSLMMSLNRPAPPTMKEIATLLAMDRTTLTAKLKPLERRGFVEVAVDPSDKRNRRLSLTKEGQIALAAAVPLWTEKHAEIEGSLGEDADSFRKNLNRLS